MAEQVFSKTVQDGGWGDDKTVKHDFAAQDELLVTITLSEYRFLIKQQGFYEKKLDEKEKSNSELYSENLKLKNTLDMLRDGLESEE